MAEEVMNQFVKSQLIDLFNSQTKSQIFKSQDRDDTQIDDFEFNINEVSEQQCYDALIENSQSKIDVQKNKVRDLDEKREQLKISLKNLQQEIYGLEEKLKQEKIRNQEARQNNSFNQANARQIQEKQEEYKQLLKKYEDFIKVESMNEIKAIQLEYNNKANTERIQSNKIRNNKKLEERLKQEFDQVNQELYEYQNIINPQLQKDLIELQELMIENEEFSIQNLEQQKELKNQKLEEIKKNLENTKEDQNNQIQQNLAEKEQRLLNIFQIYNKQKKEIEELQYRNQQLQKNVDIGKQKVNSQRSLFKKIKKNQSFKLFCLGIIIMIGIQVIFTLLQDNYTSFNGIQIDLNW